MKTVEIRIASDVYERAEALARSRQCSVEELVSRLIVQADERHETRDETMGLFADDPDLIDAVVEQAMADRERRWANARRE